MLEFDWLIMPGSFSRTLNCEPHPLASVWFTLSYVGCVNVETTTITTTTTELRKQLFSSFLSMHGHLNDFFTLRIPFRDFKIFPY